MYYYLLLERCTCTEKLWSQWVQCNQLHNGNNSWHDFSVCNIDEAKMMRVKLLLSMLLQILLRILLVYICLGALNNHLPRRKYNIIKLAGWYSYSMQSWSQSLEHVESIVKPACTGVTTRMCTVHVRDYITWHATTTFLQFDQLDKPRVMSWSMSQQKAIKPKTQDSQRRSL